MSASGIFSNQEKRERQYLIAVHPDGKVDKKEIKRVPHLDQLKEIVGGWIETVPYFNTYEGSPCIAFCNEEGKLHGSPFNPFAQTLWLKATKMAVHDSLVGSIAIVVGSKDFLSRM